MRGLIGDRMAKIRDYAPHSALKNPITKPVDDNICEGSEL
jgi:hypothetical protein